MKDLQATKNLGRFQQLAQVTKDIRNLSPVDMLDVVRHFLDHPPKEKITFPILLTREIAALLQQHDTNNRKKVETRVRALCREVARGKFKHTHQGIAVAFDENGGSLLLDGGKRVLMRLRGEEDLWIDITFGLPTDVFPAIDTTQPRAPAQTFVRQEGRPNANAQTAAVRAMARICGGAVIAPASANDCEEWRAVFRSQLDWSMDNLKSLDGLRTAELMATMAVLRRLYPEKAEEFMHQLTTGEMLTAGDPALTLRNYVMVKRVARAGGNNRQITAMTAMNAFSAFLGNLKLYRNSHADGGMTRFRKELNNLKKVKDLVEFWKETGSEPEFELESEPVH